MFKIWHITAYNISTKREKLLEAIDLINKAIELINDTGINIDLDHSQWLEASETFYTATDEDPIYEDLSLEDVLNTVNYKLYDKAYSLEDQANQFLP